MLRYIVFMSFMLGSLLTHAQVEMADKFRGEGKIYVVIAVILIIMAGFFYLLFNLDRKTKRLAKEVEEK